MAVAGVGVPATMAATGNVLLDPWTGAYGGLPPFDKIKPAEFQAAMMTGIEMNRAEIKAIAGQKDAPTFANTLAKMEDAGRPFNRAAQLFFIYAGTMSDDTIKKTERDISPVLAAFQDEIVQDEALFARIKAVYDARETSGLTAEEKRIADLQYLSFQRQGAGLDKAKKARLAAINKDLATLYTAFSQNQQKDEDEDFVLLESEADLAGMSDGMKTAYAEDAKRRGKAGKWAIANTRSAAEPFLVFSTKRDLREKVFKMWTNRGDNNNAANNRKTITQVLKLRQEKANLLGHPTFAHWQLANNMAKTPDNANNLMMKVWKPAVAAFRAEVAEAQALADKEGAKFKLAAWDFRHYAEKVRKAKYDLDQAEVTQYLQLDKMVEAIFFSANKVFGLSFKKLSGIPVYHPDMSVYEVTRGGNHVGLFYFDPFARTGKRSGAWMNEYRTQERFKTEVKPIVSNNCNYVKGKAGEPVLISWDDASTLFHEFGHALHGLLSNTTYPSVAGTSVKRDFVEFPSQIMERWLETPEVLGTYCLHYKTGKPIPNDLVEKIKRARNAGQGFSTTEYLASAIYDMRIHMTDASAGIDPVEFEKKVAAEIGIPDEIVLRHRPTAFGHIFSGDGYSSGYYVYIWADTLSADSIEAFKEAGSMFDAPTSKRFHDTIMSVGGSVPPEVAFRNFRGRDVDTNALMRDRGFPVS
ncbi:MAG TPA: peptidase M3 [Alphaproteobacteria bacterium]|nr:peptidase M3 [Alphaproteobacteria bacterium]